MLTLEIPGVLSAENSSAQFNTPRHSVEYIDLFAITYQYFVHFAWLIV